MRPLHHTFLRAIGCHLHSKDKSTEWWTVPNENHIYDVRKYIQFENMISNIGTPGGFIIYLDKPAG